MSQPLEAQPACRTAAATATRIRLAAERAVDDPAKLARAAQIVRIALARQRLTLDDLDAGPADGSAA